jgi:hypothetical protein
VHLERRDEAERHVEVRPAVDHLVFDLHAARAQRVDERSRIRRFLLL